jgi:hypothetical protein
MHCCSICIAGSRRSSSCQLLETQTFPNAAADDLHETNFIIIIIIIISGKN